MRALYVQKGDGIDFIAPRDVRAGEVICKGDLIGVTKLSAKAGKLGTLCLNGIFDFAKTREAFAMGSKVYWNEAECVATACCEGNKYLGMAVMDTPAEK